VVAGLAMSVAFGASAPFIQPFEHKAHASEFQTAASYKYEAYQEEALNYLNKLRAPSGAIQLKLDPILTKAAENHAKYLNMNNVTEFINSTGEDSTKSGYTGRTVFDRIKAEGGDISIGTFFDVAYLGEKTSIEDAINKLLQRDPQILENRMEYIGIGQSGGKLVIVRKVADLPYTSKGATYPSNGQTNVDVDYKPLSRDVTLYGATKGVNGTFSGNPVHYLRPIAINKNSGFTMKLFDSNGAEVDCYKNGPTLFPKEVLKYNETYTAKVSYTTGSDAKAPFVPNQKIEEVWSFTTKADGATPTQPQQPTNPVKPVFSDYEAGQYWSEDMLWATDKGLIRGFEGASSNQYLLKPYEHLTEAQFLTVLFRYLKPTELDSQPKTGWFASQAYSLAQQYKLPVLGGANNTTVANAGITRGKMAQIWVSAIKGQTVTEEEAVQFMYDAKLSDGFSATEKTYESYHPIEVLKRGQLAKFFKSYDSYLNS